jgi:type II secretory pathway component PulF
MAKALQAGRQAIVRGDALSAALGSAGVSFPPQTIEMIRDAELEGTLDQALSVVADYLLDEAGEKRVQRKKPEVRNG